MRSNIARNGAIPVGLVVRQDINQRQHEFPCVGAGFGQTAGRMGLGGLDQALGIQLVLVSVAIG
jgi:hypothetical protein